MTVFDSLTGFFPLTKTLPVKLTPIGNTLHNMQVNEVIEADEQLLQKFTRLKQMADDYHREFIAKVLENFTLKLHSDGHDDSLEEYAEMFDSDRRNNEGNRFRFNIVKSCLRLAISKAFESAPEFRKLDKKELVSDILRSRVTGEDKDVVESFSKFTSYLVPYYQTRKLYGYDEKANTIAYRCIDDNLPVFYNNLKAFEKVRKTLPQEVFDKLNEDLRSYLDGNNIGEVFKLEYFNKCLTQKGIEKYNTVLGGYNTSETHIKGLKEYIYLYNMDQKEKKNMLPALSDLKKQILSDREVISWQDMKYEDSRKMYKDLIAFHQVYRKLVASPLRQLMTEISQYDSKGIFISNKDCISQISLALCGKWSAIREVIYLEFSRNIKRKKKESTEKYDKRVYQAIDGRESYSIAEIDSCLLEFDKKLADYYMKMGAVDNKVLQRENYFATIENAWTELQPMAVRFANAENSHQPKEDEVVKIKVYLDAVLQLYHFVLPLKGEGNELGRDAAFYEVLDSCMLELQNIVGLYNRIRSFVTRKPFTTNKIKLNFGSPQLLSGWSSDNEAVHRSLLLQKDGRLFLVVLEKGQHNLFTDESDILKEGEDFYEKVEYNYFGDAAKQLPKRCFAACNIDLFRPSEEILQIRKRGSYLAGNNFNIDDLHKLIDYYKGCVMKMQKWCEVNFNWKDTSEYKSISEFVKSFTAAGYYINYQKVREQTVERLVNEGKIYLFRLDKKDYSPYSKGRKSLYTMYMDMLFHPANLEKVVYKLSGGAEMFYRKASVKSNRPTHPAGLPIANKNPEVAVHKPESVFAYDLIKDKRYTKDMMMVHLPVTVNYFAADSKGMPVTMQVRRLIREGQFKHIIGIHRGERNLIYVSVLDMNGKIVEQKPLNIIESTCGEQPYSKDYKALLQRKEEERLQSRKDWKTIDKIKDIKQGYLSQAISTITDMVLEYEALIVMEAINKQFKRSRQKIEQNIYAKFEQQLIDKLNFLVKKNRDMNEPGGLLNALQLTDKVEPGLDLFQNGIIFYTPAAYTANVCPVTGFVSLFNLKNGKIEEVKAFFSKFDSIRFNKETGLFDFTFDYNNFTDKAENARTCWTVSTFGQRCGCIESAGQKKRALVDLTKEFKNLFTKHGVDYTGNLKEAIATVDKRSFYDGLVELFNLMMQMRNIMGDNIDYLISPASDENGRYFLSSPENKEWPIDTDANTAYNVARKGLLMVQSILRTTEKEKVNLGITNEKWMKYIQCIS